MRDSSGKFLPGQSGNPDGRPRGAVSKLTRLAQALTEPNAEKIINRALLEASFLHDPKFVLFFMERIWPRPQRVDDALIERMEDLERRVMSLEGQGKSGSQGNHSGLNKNDG
jgi:hypothetical protein